MSTNRYMLRAAVLTGTAGLTGVLAAGVASAHVTANVYGEQPEQGGYTAIVLRVPNEEEKAGTSKVEVTIPAEYRISSARTQPMPGWTAKVAKNQEGVATGITWTAKPGNEIPAGSTSYEEFHVSLGKLPEDAEQLVLATKQTYTDGQVSNWNQVPKEGSEEPEHPAPVIELAEPSGDGHGGAAKEPEVENAAASGEAGDVSTGDGTARWLGGAGLVVGALGLGVGAGAMLRTRKRSS